MSVQPVFVRDDETFAAPVLRVRITRIAVTAAGEQILDPDAPVWEPGQSRPLPLDAEWPADVTGFGYGRFHFAVPQAARRLVRDVDSAGELLQARFFDIRGLVVSTITVVRDALGRTVRIVQVHGDDPAPVVEVRTSYNDANRQIVTTTFLCGLVVSEQVRTVNEHGLVEREEQTTAPGGGIVAHRVYSMNDRGDWIECAVYSDGASVPHTIVRREIEYRE